MNINNLWPDLEAITEKTPIDILHEQAEALHQKYSKKIIGGVTTVVGENETKITIALYLMSVLTKYNYRLLWFEQPIDTIFPFKVQAFSNPSIEMGEANDSESFQKILNKIITHPNTKNIINTLLKVDEAEQQLIEKN